MKSILLSILIVIAGSLSAQAETNTFRDATAGITITKPNSWHTLSTQEVLENRERVELEDKELQKLMRERAKLPLFAFSKYGLDHNDLNPTINVLLRPLGNLKQLSPQRLLHMAVLGLKQAYEDFRFIEVIHETKVDGMAAATMKAQYTVKDPHGRSFAVLSHMWTVPRGAYLFLIGMSGPISGPDKSEKEFEQALQSIRIEK